jgi:putative ABC transport system substrate-binding protein
VERSFLTLAMNIFVAHCPLLLNGVNWGHLDPIPRQVARGFEALARSGKLMIWCNASGRQHMATRRRIVLSLGIGLLAPLASSAQTQTRMRLIGWLQEAAPSDRLELQYVDAFKGGLRDHGYVEGRDYRLEKRYTTLDAGDLPALATELVALNVDIIVALTTSAAIAARNVTRDIPIVTDTGDPVGNGLATSLSHPGGNVTGMTSLSQELYIKRVDLLRQLLPGIQRIGFLYNPAYAADARGLKQFESACSRIAVRVIRAPARSASELPSAFAALTQARAQGLVVTSRSQLGSRDKIIDSAAQNHLPAMYSRSVFVDEGGLIGYGPSYVDVYRKCAGYVDRIFKGARPGDLPIEQPDKFELVVNLKTAAALGLAIPQSLLLRADRVIE